MKRQPFFVNHFSTPPRAKGQAARRGAIAWVGIALLGGAFFSVTASHAQVVTFDTSGATSAQSMAATYNATQQGAGVSGTPQLTRTTLTATGGAAGSFFSNANGNNTNTFLFNSNYVGFTTNIAAGSVFYATSISFNSQGSNTAPNSYGIGYSTDNFVNTVGLNTYTGTTVTTSVARVYDIPDLISNDTLSVRLYNYGATAINGAAAAATGSFRVISPTVAGSTPSTGADIALAANTEVRNAGALTLSGVISGNGFAITKTGAGTLTLTGQNTLGATNATSITVSAGTLLANNNPALGSFAGAGNVAVSTGATLGGTGSTVGAVTVANGGVISPGAAAGATGTFAVGALTLNDTSSLVFDLGAPGGANDLLSVGTALTLDGKLTVNGLSGFGVGQYQLLSYGDSGNFINNTLDVTSAPGGFSYAIDTTTPGAVYLNVSAVPEPTTVLGGLLMVGALGWSQRRRLGGWAGQMRAARGA